MTYVIYDRMFAAFMAIDGTTTPSLEAAAKFQTRRAAMAHSLFNRATDTIISEDDAFIEKVVRDLR